MKHTGTFDKPLVLVPVRVCRNETENEWCFASFRDCRDICVCGSRTEIDFVVSDKVSRSMLDTKVEETE